MAWTNEQRDAITGRGSLIVSAAAGSGKTAVLTERAARLIGEGADPEKFLIVTFTRAAAAEMKKRVSDRLCAMAGEAGEADAARLFRASAEMGRASISTIDAFCAHVLRRHFQRAGLDPGFRAAEEAEAEALRQEAMEELLEEKYASRSFCALVDAFGGEDEFIEGADRLYDFLCAQARPMEWLRNAAESYALPKEEIMRSPQALWYVACERRKLRAALDVLAARRRFIAQDYPATAAILDDDFARAGAALLQESCEGYGAALGAADLARFSMRGAPEGLKKYVKDARDKLKALLREQRAAFGRPASLQGERIAALRPQAEELQAFMEGYMAKYSLKKREEGLIDYADMERMALELMRDPETAAEYRDRFSYVFVDEYQDCNPVQNEIFSALSGRDNRFFVGDVKQSIYRFRMAEPKIFAQTLKKFERGEGRCVYLKTNFRNSRAVIDTVNGIFSRAMRGGVGGVEYDENASLFPGREAEGGAELHILPRSLMLDPEEGAFLDDDGAEQLAAAEAEALFAAERIKALVNTEFTDREGKRRRYRYGDIVVLHGAPKNIAEAWVQTLSREGVPAYAELTGGYFDAAEVQVFLNLLRIIDNPVQDIPLLSVLRSPIGGFSTEELITLRAGNKGESCYASLKAAAGSDFPLGAKAGAFLKKLSGWRGRASLYGLEELIPMLLDGTGFERYVSALPGGQARRGNLEAMLHSALAYCRSRQGLRGFLRYMDRARDTGRLGSAPIASADVVRLISIHKSKGLEYPAVILAGLSKRFNQADKRSGLVLDRELGLGLRAVRDNTRESNLYHSAIAAKAWEETVSEHLRVLYVAMTRASERLIMLCSFRDVKKELERALTPLTPAIGAAAARYSDWVLPAVLDTPSGNPIREYLGLPPLAGRGALEVTVHGGVVSAAAGTSLPREAYLSFAAGAREKGPGEYAGLFAWEYPFGEDTRTPSKVSVSDLLGNRPELPEYPAFMSGLVPERPAAAGSAAHALLKRIPIGRHTEESVRKCLDSLVEEGAVSGAAADCVDIHGIAAFFDSGLGRRMAASPRVERELPFNRYVPARELLGADTDEPVLLQGVIDCCFIEDGKWVLIDYKTDFVPEGRAGEAAERHRRQLALYRDALEALSGIPVKEAFVHFLGTGESVRL